MSVCFISLDFVSYKLNPLSSLTVFCPLILDPPNLIKEGLFVLLVTAVEKQNSRIKKLKIWNYFNYIKFLNLISMYMVLIYFTKTFLSQIWCCNYFTCYNRIRSRSKYTKYVRLEDDLGEISLCYEYRMSQNKKSSVTYLIYIWDTNGHNPSRKPAFHIST